MREGGAGSTFGWPCLSGQNPRRQRLARCSRPVGKTPEHHKRCQQEKDDGRGRRLTAAQVKNDREQHDGRESGCGPRTEPGCSVGSHGQDDAEGTGDLSDTDKGREPAGDAGRSVLLRLSFVLFVGEQLHPTGGDEMRMPGVPGRSIWPSSYNPPFFFNDKAGSVFSDDVADLFERSC
jgi:hypothetical protein